MIFVYGGKDGLILLGVCFVLFCFCIWASSCPRTIYWKDYPFSIDLLLHLCWKSIIQIFTDLFLLLYLISFKFSSISHPTLFFYFLFLIVFSFSFYFVFFLLEAKPFFLSFFIWWMTLIFQVLNFPYIPVINPTLSSSFTLFLYYFIHFAKFLFRIFAFMFMKDIVGF